MYTIESAEQCHATKRVKTDTLGKRSPVVPSLRAEPHQARYDQLDDDAYPTRYEVSISAGTSHIGRT